MSAAASVRRFSSDVLDEPDEYIFGCIATSFVSLSRSSYKQDGVVYFTEKSVILVPGDARAPILKVPLDRIRSLCNPANRKQLRVTKPNHQLSTITMTTNTVYSIRRWGVSHAYEADGQFSNGDNVYFFYPKVVKTRLLTLLRRLVDTAKLPNGGAERRKALVRDFETRRSQRFMATSPESFRSGDIVRDLVAYFYSRSSFALPSDESVRLRQQATLIEYSRQTRCHVVLTRKSLHFAPTTDPFMSRGSIPLRSVCCADALPLSGDSTVASIACYGGRSLLIRFASKDARDQAVAQLAKGLPARPTLAQATESWRIGAMSTYDYISTLNARAGRTVHLCSAYPVFPWALKNLSSRSIDLTDKTVYNDLGALPPATAKAVSVALVLARVDPDLLLRINRGRFGPSQSIFSDVAASFNKFDLTPEFYSGDGAFLVNTRGTNFAGQTGDVKLPAWAKTPKQFVDIMAQALEHENFSAVTAWIDRVFGVSRPSGSALVKLFDRPHVARAPRNPRLAELESQTSARRLRILDLEERAKHRHVVEERRQPRPEIEQLRRQMRELEKRAVDAEKRERSLKRKVASYMNTPIFRTVDNVNNYIARIKKELEQRKRESQSWRRRFDREVVERMAWRKRYEDQRERADRAHGKFVATNRNRRSIRLETMKLSRQSDDDHMKTIFAQRERLIALKTALKKAQEKYHKACKFRQLSEERMKRINDEVERSLQCSSVTSSPAASPSKASPSKASLSPLRDGNSAVEPSAEPLRANSYNNTDE